MIRQRVYLHIDKGTEEVKRGCTRTLQKYICNDKIIILYIEHMRYNINKSHYNTQQLHDDVCYIHLFSATSRSIIIPTSHFIFSKNVFVCYFCTFLSTKLLLHNYNVMTGGEL